MMMMRRERSRGQERKKKNDVRTDLPHPNARVWLRGLHIFLDAQSPTPLVIPPAPPPRRREPLCCTTRDGRFAWCTGVCVCFWSRWAVCVWCTACTVCLCLFSTLLLAAAKNNMCAARVRAVWRPGARALCCGWEKGRCSRHTPRLRRLFLAPAHTKHTTLALSPGQCCSHPVCSRLSVHPSHSLIDTCPSLFSISSLSLSVLSLSTASPLSLFTPFTTPNTHTHLSLSHKRERPPLSPPTHPSTAPNTRRHPRRARASQTSHPSICPPPPLKPPLRALFSAFCPSPAVE